MKKVYFGKNLETVKKLNNLISDEIDRLEEIGNFGQIGGRDFHEKYEDPYFDSYRESEADYEIPLDELLGSFEVLYGYLLFLRKSVALEEEWEQEIKEEEEEREREWEKMSWKGRVF